MKGDPAVLKKVSVSLPFGLGSAEWQSDDTQRRAAWSLYVELVTRIAVQSLELDEGLLREALNSLYSLFGTTRQVLKDAGPLVSLIFRHRFTVMFSMIPLNDKEKDS